MRVMSGMFRSLQIKTVYLHLVMTILSGLSTKYNSYNDDKLHVLFRLAKF